MMGEPFVGQAGRLLDNMLAALGMARTRNVYIANVLKCRPPGNRNPEPEEVARCTPYLLRQIALIQPKLIVAMGRFAAQTLLEGYLRQLQRRGTSDSYDLLTDREKEILQLLAEGKSNKEIASLLGIPAVQAQAPLLQPGTANAMPSGTATRSAAGWAAAAASGTASAGFSSSSLTAAGSGSSWRRARPPWWPRPPRAPSSSPG